MLRANSRNAELSRSSEIEDAALAATKQRKILDGASSLQRKQSMGGLEFTLQPRKAESPRSQDAAGTTKRGRGFGSFWTTMTSQPDSEWDAETESLSDDGFTSISPVKLPKASPKDLSEDADKNSWLNSSVSHMLNGWGRAAGKALHDTEGASDVHKTGLQSDVKQEFDTQGITPEALEGILLWQNSAYTFKVFAGGLYALICLRQLVNGVDLIQPSTVLALALLCYLLYNSFGRWWRPKAQGMQAYGHTLMQQAHVDRVVNKTAKRMGQILSASTSMVLSHLSGCSTGGSRFWLAVLFWLTVIIGELGWLSQSSMAICVWTAMFTMPLLYQTCHIALDTLVDEGCIFLLSALQGGQKGALVAAVTVGMVTFVVIDARVLIRASLSGLTFLAALFWRAHMMKPASSKGVVEETSSSCATSE